MYNKHKTTQHWTQPLFDTNNNLMTQHRLAHKEAESLSSAAPLLNCECTEQVALEIKVQLESANGSFKN